MKPVATSPKSESTRSRPDGHPGLGGCRTPVSVLMLLAHPRRVAVSISVIAFCSLLMFSQLGFMLGLFDSMSRLIVSFSGDLVVRSKARHNLGVGITFPRARLQQALMLPEVSAVHPIQLESWGTWRSVGTKLNRTIRVIGANVNEGAIELPGLEAAASQLRKSNTASFDKLSRHFFGDVSPGTMAELNGQRVEVVGNFTLGPDFQFDGNLVMHESNFFRYFPEQSPQRVHLGAIDLREGASPSQVKERIIKSLPGDIDVLTKEELAHAEHRHWMKNTSAGQIFLVSLFVAFVVGILLSYQVIHNEVKDNIKQFAMLRAIGYSNLYIASVVLTQALFFGVAGLIPGALLGSLLFQTLEETSRLSIQVTPERVLLVSILTIAMCLLASVAAVRRVLVVDPVELYH
ncbi:FtsX-like permease family protein [Planctomycetes bacterium Pan216]|uniref:FtsX-like permease family protein n=1 Tax=Kolteria novifilia TaxID=2527975 RepID=A0A518B7Y1_9BACT|nr:FtsX-like permease family protein [Planctomycetes bacterium Pan216]